MSFATNLDDHIPLVGQLGRWLRNWRSRRMAVAELDRCGPDEIERVARDIGVSGAALCILAGKWPDAADLLGQRIGYLNIDEAAVARTKPQASRICSGSARFAPANADARATCGRILSILCGKTIARIR